MLANIIVSLLVRLQITRSWEGFITQNTSIWLILKTDETDILTLDYRNAMLIILD